MRIQAKRTACATRWIIPCVAAVVATLAGPFTASADPLGAGDGAIYKLDSDSEFQQGCFAPCMCPIMLQQGVRGTFKLTYEGLADGIHVYAVDDISWTVPFGDPELRVIGSGSYEFGTPDPAQVLQHRMQLDLWLGDNPVEHFDSGWMPVGQYGGIDITVSVNDMYCYDTVFVIHAAPVPVTQIHHYELVDGSTFQRGCYDPCDCFIGPELPMAGAFDLVPLEENPLFTEFTVVNVAWQTLPDPTGESFPITGFGTYHVRAEFAVQHRLSLELIIGDEERTHFDSGLIVGGFEFPGIGIVVSVNGMYCYDTVLHVVAEPIGGVTCSRIDPDNPCLPDEFCKFPPGTCEDLTVPGICTPIPEACPEYYDPVCGCDGITYDNECFADATAVSIAHHGICQECAAQRLLADPDPTYCPGVPKRVRVLLSPEGVTAVALEDVPPAGWEVTNISHGGFFDDVNGKVKWGPFFGGEIPWIVFYDVVAPNSADVIACFTGTISLDGVNEPICGDGCIELQCAPFMAADTPQPPCPQCPVGDCTTCPDNGCRDRRISLCELVGYACAWLRGCNDDLAGLVRAAYVWRHGECYCWNEVEQNWFPTDCPPPSSGICGTANLGPGDIDPSESGSAIAYLRSSRVDGRHTRAKEVKVVIVIEAPELASAMALDFELPTGWEPAAISDDGKWDETHRKVKWGPFYDDLTRRITFRARRSMGATIRPTRVSANEPQVGRFSGMISFDGHNQPIVVKR